MTTYTLPIEIFGPGTAPNHRSHWGCMISQTNNTDYGDFVQVEVIDDRKLWFSYTPRYGTKIVDRQAVGMCKIVDLNPQERRRAIEVVEGVAPPIDGVKRCQDWRFDALIWLKSEELVNDGTCAFWEGLIGKPAGEVTRVCGDLWVSLV
ncbi:hypothetical protein N7522_013736 [Penicillium canescens]|nr:hypothetical protein N7522_013736 [Penicillium canescens]